MKMKTLNQTLVLVSLTAGAAWLLAGCGTTSGYKQADKTGEGIATFREEVLNGKKAIDATVASLDQVAASAATDPRKPFEQFSKDVANLESTAAKIRKRGQDMREQGDAYFAQWQKQLAEVKNPDIQKLASERQAKLKEAFDNIKKVAEPLKSQFDPWMSDLKDLQKYLSNDLTVNGVDAAKGLFAKATTQGKDVQKSMDALIAELNTISATISVARAQAQTNAPPAEKK
jgi:chromosome segregation ATPase